MDIVAINNQVVLMRGSVKQAKVHTIRKMSRQVKSLRSKKGNEDQMTKNKRKADRLVKEIAVIKELNIDKVSRFALSNQHTQKTLPKEMFDDLSEFCMIKLAEHKAIVLAVNACRKKFDNWEKELPQLLKMCEIRKMFKLTQQPYGKLRQRNKKPKSKNPKFGLSISEHDSQYNQCNFAQQRALPHAEKSSDGGALTEERPEYLAEESNHSEDNHATLDDTNSSVEDFSNNVSRHNDSGSASLKIDTNKCTKSFKKVKTISSTVIKEVIPERKEKPVVIPEKRVGEMEVRRFILSEIQESPLGNDEGLLPKINADVTPSSDEIRRKTKCKDSFFIGNNDGSVSEDDFPSNGSYVDSDEDESKTTRPKLESTFIGSLRNEGTDIFLPHFRKSNRIRTSDSSKKRDMKFSGKTTGRPTERHSFVRNNDLRYAKQQSSFKIQPNRQERRQQLAQAQKPGSLAATSDQTSLHPSWDAKRKLKLQSQIHQFQGKKIKFDD